MEITFSAANAVGLNNPGTEIFTLVKDGSGNFINPPSYDKMRAYLSSGEVPMLFVTDVGGETGSLYQLADYSETENKIRFSNDKTTIAFSAGASAPVVSDVVPKPLTYDYMPEGYPTKNVQIITLMVEQEIAFSNVGGLYAGALTNAFSLAEGETYTVNWDGTKYECVCSVFNNSFMFGNLSITGAGEDTGEPFIYSSFDGAFVTLDTSPSHTISVIGPKIEYTEIDKNFLPALPYMNKTNPVGDGSFSLNRKANTDIGNYSFAEGSETTASGVQSHAEGKYTTASGANSHAEGFRTTASAGDSHAEGVNTTASGIYSHAEGNATIAASESQHVQGKFNIADNNNVYAHIVGNGTSDTKKSNAHTLDWSGNAWYAGSVEGIALILPSSTAGSTKKFKITVDDSGTISATEVT